MQLLYNISAWVMKFCYEICHNYGLAILLFTLLSKIVLIPISIWVQKNSIKMVKMQPEINYMKIKFFGDHDRIAEEQNNIFKREKYHAMASIVPMFVQIVLLMAVIAAIKAGMADTSINMYFLGIDLSAVPNNSSTWFILSPIAAGFSAYLMCLAQNMSNVLQAEQSKINKYGAMILSIALSLYLGWFVSVGVALYWVASNLLAIIQLYLLNWAINPKKYVNYEQLKASKTALTELEHIGNGQKIKLNRETIKREKADYKRFFSVVNKHIVFYSESSGFYKYYSGIIQHLLTHTNITIHYITGDPNDIIFLLADNNEKIKAYYIGEKKLITLMMKMESDIVVMTMPDLENFHIKRSYVKKDIEYIYIPHGMDSLNMTMRTGSVNHYDTVFCVGKHQKEEIMKTEQVYNLPSKRLIEWGYSLLDEMCSEYDASKKGNVTVDKKNILIAPSWQPDNIVDSCLETILDKLKNRGYNIILRPHPQHVRHKSEYMETLKTKYADNEDIEIQTDFSSNNTVFEADLLITDWSGIAYEYAYTTRKPVLFINTPMKVMNPEYKKIGVEPINITLREKIGCSVDTDELDMLEEKVQNLFNQKDSYHEAIGKFVEEYIYNLGSSAEVGAKYIVSSLKTKIEERKNGN
ncbi:MAG: membrane protein insertase YidC [Oscillospiraceae bacterium]|nr:membrane protein insertase YidC [Oscillospiraceae bacterium]